MPYSTQVSGTVITASWANANVRDQTVTPFATAAARTAAITAPIEGMLTYRNDGKTFEGYDGSNWVPVQMRAHARKTADEFVISSTTLQNDDQLTWHVQANTEYALDLHLRYTSNAAADLKIGWAYPGGALMQWTLIHYDASLLVALSPDYGITDIPIIGGNGSALWAHATGLVSTAATTGFLTLQWAQNTSNATNTTMHAASWGTLTGIH